MKYCQMLSFLLKCHVLNFSIGLYGRMPAPSIIYASGCGPADLPHSAVSHIDFDVCGLQIA